MKNFSDFICHGCLKKYKYEGNFKELVGKRCPHCDSIVWTQEEQHLIEKLDDITNPLQAELTIAMLPPLERRLFQFWTFVALATQNLPTLDEDFVKDLK
jgi:hypothetical protein